MGHQSYVLLCTETALSNPPAVIPKSSCDVHLLRSPWFSTEREILARDGVAERTRYISLVMDGRASLELQGRRKVWKSGRWTSINVVGIICPIPVDIGLTDLPKSGGVGYGPRIRQSWENEEGSITTVLLHVTDTDWTLSNSCCMSWIFQRNFWEFWQI